MTRTRSIRVAALVATLAAVLSAAVPARATTPARIEQEPTAVELAAQQAEAARLTELARRQAAQVDDAQAALRGAAVLAGQALEEYAGAVHTLHLLEVAQRRRELQLTRAQAEMVRTRQELGRWARRAYQGGGGLAGDATVTTLLNVDGGQDVGTTMEVLRRVGRDRSRTLQDLVTAQGRADAAADAAADATDRAAVAAVRAADARRASEAAVERHRRALGLAESALARTQGEAARARTRADELRTRRAAVRAPTPITGGNRVSGPVGSCAGGEVQGYANGRIPLAALCALTTAPGHHLRADAAYAFDRLSQAYAQRFGRPVCVTDSYRSYPAQVSVYARKPGLAAVPGTSNHGWGRATDLCGGIQSFGTREHQWMVLNASLYGWFHPGWAQQGGSKPEPWHWEFGG